MIGPFIKSKNTTTRMMINVFIALIPIILFSFYKNGIVPYANNKTDIFGLFYPLTMILITSVSTFVFEVIYSFIVFKNKNRIEYLKHTYSFMPGLFLALVLPINTPIYIIIFGAFIATIVGKMLFGGFGQNIFNPALIGVMVVFAFFSLNITDAGGYKNAYEIDTISMATPLSNAKMVNGIGTYDELVKPYDSVTNLFVGFKPGAIGETSSLLILIAFIYLVLTRTIKWRITVAYIGSVFFITLLIALFSDTGLWYPIFHVLTGGLLFGAVFMATDPVTSPTISKSQILYGITLGLITVSIRYFTSYPEGVLTAILTMNLLVFIFDKIGLKAKSKVIYFYAFLLIAILLGVYIVTEATSKIKISAQNKPFHILSKDTNLNKTVYVVTQKSFGGVMKLEIVLENDKIISITPSEYMDTLYQKVTDSDYLNYIINNQDSKEIDTISGATITTSAIRDATLNVLEDARGK